MKPKKSVILHIGMAKTATTSIQVGLKGYTDGVTRYARLGLSNHSIPMMTAFRKDPHRHLYYRKRGLGQQAVESKAQHYRDQLQQELARNEEHLIISGEDLCRFSVKEVARLKAFIEPSCERFRVLAYIREPIGFCSSVYQQVARHRQITELHLEMPRYRKWFEKYIELFDREAVEFVLFEPDSFRNGCVITDFCDRSGIDPSQIDKQRRNASLSTEAVALLIDWNRDGIKGSGSEAEVKAMTLLLSTLRNEFPGTFRLHRDLVVTALDSVDCDWMEGQSGFSLSQPARSGDEAGVRSNAEMAERAEACLPQLKEILDARSLTAAAERPAAMIDALYLEALQQV